MYRQIEISDACDLMMRAEKSKLSDVSNDIFEHDSIIACISRAGELVIVNRDISSDHAREKYFGETTRGASGRIWQAGFFAHAKALFGFASSRAPTMVLGHSVGAAVAQIVAVSMNLPAVCFASPMPLRGRRWVKGENQILNVCRRDDPETRLPPPWLKFRHVGRVHWISQGACSTEGNHSMQDYAHAMSEGRIRPRLPCAWPKS